MGAVLDYLAGTCDLKPFGRSPYVSSFWPPEMHPPSYLILFVRICSRGG